MERYKYINLPLALLPKEIVEQYKLTTVRKGRMCVCRNPTGNVRIETGKTNCKGLSDLEHWTTRLLPMQSHTWPVDHKWRPIMFSLVVDDFGVKYVGKEHANNLIKKKKKYHPLSVDWTGSLYCGIMFKRNHKNRWVDLSIPVYVEACPQEFQHPKPRKSQHAPHWWENTNYGAK